MKLQRLCIAGFALAAAIGLRAESSAQNWIESYYANPAPDQLVRAVYQLSDEGYFERPGQTAVAIGFFSTVFANHPERVDSWFSRFRDLPTAHQRLMAAALWQSGDQAGPATLRRLARDSKLRTEIEKLTRTQAPLLSHTPVKSESSMNLHWGAFLADGDERHVTNILAAIGAGQPGLTEAARYSLAMAAASHPRVMEICRAELSRQPNEVQSVLRAALNEAESLRAQPRI